jgi:DNA-binding CsgD family transcriptional regulator/tetratricopeptide (TPR) repeat protein
VLGAEFSVADVGLVSGRPAGELAGVVEQAVTAGVVERAGGRLRFRHGLIRQVLYEQIPGSVREALHAQAARALAGSGAPAERVAAQLMAAPEAGQEWLWDWLAQAAAALIYRAPQTAAQLLRQALSALPSDDARREELETALVMAAFLLVDSAEVERTARPLLARTTDPDRAAEIAWLLTRALQRVGQPGDAVAVLAEAVTRPGIGPVWQARLQSAQAVSHLLFGQWDQAEQTAGQALADAERVEDRLAAGHALHVLSVVEYDRRNAAGRLGYIDRALAVIGDDPQTTDLRLILLANRESVLEDQDRMAEAGATIREALALAERVGARGLGLISTVAGDYYFETGQWDEALAVLQAIAELPENERLRLLLHGQVALIAAHRGQWQLADKHLAAVQDQTLETVQDRELGYCLLRARALAAERAGGPAGAVAVLGWCLDPAVGQDMPERHLLLPSLARAAFAAEDLATVVVAGRAAAGEASRDPLPAKAAAAGWCQGLADGDPQRVLVAADYYQQAGRPLDQAQSLEDAAVLLAGRGELAAARRAFGTAARLYRELGAEWDLGRADARLRLYGVRRGRAGRPAVSTGWDALTPTEVKIARLVAEGRSNPDIAAELFLSRNTVQTHVSHILAKLGANSRANVVRQALQQADTAPAG